MSSALLEAVRDLRVADTGLGVKPLLAKLREQQPDLGAGAKEVREALTALKAESEAKATSAAATTAAALLAADEGCAPAHEAPSLACVSCARMPSEMGDGRVKHPVCPKCVTLKMPTTYFCSVNCPGNPVAWKTHTVFHKELKKNAKIMEDGGASQQRDREAAEEQTRNAAQWGDKYEELVADSARYPSTEVRRAARACHEAVKYLELLAEGARYTSELDYRRAAMSQREAIALDPDMSNAYYDLGFTLSDSGHKVEAAQRFLEAKEREQVGSEGWAFATASAFGMLRLKECSEVAKPEWWNDEGLKPLSARVVRAAPNNLGAHMMRAIVLGGEACGKGALEARPRSSAELKQAATHFQRAAVLTNAPAQKATLVTLAGHCLRGCRRLADDT